MHSPRDRKRWGLKVLRLRIPRISASTLLRRAALAYLIVWVLSPPLAYGTGWRVLAVLAMLLWLALETWVPRSVLLRPSWPVLVSLVFVLYTAVIEWLVPDSSAISRQFPVWVILFFLMVGESFTRGRDGDARFCFWLVLLILPVWSLGTLWGLQTFGMHAARVVVKSTEEARELSGQGVGGYGFVYTVVLCLPFFAGLFFHRDKVLKNIRVRWKRAVARFLILGNFLISMLLVLRAGYSIAVLLSVFSVASVLLIRSRRPLPFAISTCFVGLLVLLVGLSIGPALGALENVVIGTEYSAKVRDIRASLEGGGSTGTVEGRTERYSRSWEKFTENPLLGTLKFDDVGKHSAILDRFAQYGFVVGLLFLMLLAYVPLRALRAPYVPIGLALGFLVVAIGFPMLNNVFMSWGVVLYMFSRGVFSVIGASRDQVRNGRAVKEMARHA